MDFEQIFRKQRAPKDYVSLPAQLDPLDQFFKERTAPARAPKVSNMFGSLMPDEVSTTAAAPKVDLAPKEVASPMKEDVAIAANTSAPVEDKIEQIRQSIFAKMSSPETSDISISEKTVERTPSSEPLVKPESITWADAAMGLIPVAADALTGGTGVSSQVGAKYYGDLLANEAAAQKEFNRRLMDIQKARSLSMAKGDGKLYEALDENGNPVWKTKEQAIGSGVYKPGKGNFEEWKMKQDYLQGLKTALKSSSLDKKSQEAIMDREMKLAQEWRSDEFTKGTRKVADSFKRIMSINPNSANPVEDMGLIFDLMKALDPQSVVRESEQAMAIGARSYDDVINYFDSVLSGRRKLTPTQVVNIKKFASNLYKKRIDSQTAFDAQFEKVAKKYGLDPENIVQKMGDGAPVMWKNTKTGKWDVILVPKSQVDSLPEGAIPL